MNVIPCRAIELAEKLLKLSDDDMEKVYLLLKGKLNCAERAYSIAKEEKQKRKAK